MGMITYLSETRVSEWHERFQERRENDDECPGWSVTSKSNRNGSKRQLIKY